MGALAVLLVVSASAGAQTTGRIQGRVKDADERGLPGVRVTIESDQLQGCRTARTEADGQFRLTSLPPGRYDVLFQRDGYTPVSNPGVKVSLDRSATLEVTISPAFEEAMTVIAQAPIVDVSSGSTGAVFPEKLFLELPVSRTFEELGFAAPGATDGGSTRATRPSAAHRRLRIAI
jgi:hypothetical protein